MSLTDQVRSLAIISDKLIGTDDGNLDPGNTAHIALVNELVAAGVWSPTDRSALVLKATDNISRAVELGLGKARVGHVEKARRI